MKKKVKKVQGFVQNKKTGHPSYAFKQKQRRVEAIGVTHDGDETHGAKIKLKHNVNPEDDRDCYIKVKVEVQDCATYKEKAKMKGWRVHSEDQPTIDTIIKQTKKHKKRR